ncbi:hypothetical protein AVEN_110905-1 [Araneus ventricosus]|uniref:EGF-like domain-containing protein n=1 Tax=Araneus ventricosus TaxID=182803 RepID=A0A4Y2RDI9_ARAVE|nr:hypothetical protein AVEN_110905-1 [Araneus ventricosus]
MHCVGNELMLLLILTALHVHCRTVLKTHNRNETDILLSLKREARIEKCDKDVDCNNGEKCVEDIDCDNGGECNAKTGRCDCIPGTSGVNCATVENCTPLNCEEKDAKCIFDIKEGQPTCKCNDDNFYYEEEKCNNRLCIPNPCKNGGSCLEKANEEGGFKCICHEMWKGATCEEGE